MHKERIFSASSARHQGTSSGNMKPCPLCLCVVFSCPLLIFPSLPPFPVLRSQAPPRGGGERSVACSYGTRVPAREGRTPALPGLSLAGQGPPVLPTPSACPLSSPASRPSSSPPCFGHALPGVAFVFPSRPLRPVSVSLFYCALRSLLSGAPAAPLRCVVLRPARCLPRHFSLPSVRSIFPAPLPSWPPPYFGHVLPGVAFGLSSVLAPLSCFSPSAGSRGGPGA